MTIYEIKMQFSKQNHHFRLGEDTVSACPRRVVFVETGQDDDTVVNAVEKQRVVEVGGDFNDERDIANELKNAFDSRADLAGKMSELDKKIKSGNWSTELHEKFVELKTNELKRAAAKDEVLKEIQGKSRVQREWSRLRINKLIEDKVASLDTKKVKAIEQEVAGEAREMVAEYKMSDDVLKSNDAVNWVFASTEWGKSDQNIYDSGIGEKQLRQKLVLQKLLKPNELIALKKGDLSEEMRVLLFHLADDSFLDGMLKFREDKAGKKFNFDADDKLKMEAEFEVKKVDGKGMKKEKKSIFDDKSAFDEALGAVELGDDLVTKKTDIYKKLKEKEEALAEIRKEIFEDDGMKNKNLTATKKLEGPSGLEARQQELSGNIEKAQSKKAKLEKSLSDPETHKDIVSINDEVKKLEDQATALEKAKTDSSSLKRKERDLEKLKDVASTLGSVAALERDLKENEDHPDRKKTDEQWYADGPQLARSMGKLGDEDAKDTGLYKELQDAESELRVSQAKVNQDGLDDLYLAVTDATDECKASQLAYTSKNKEYNDSLKQQRGKNQDPNSNLIDNLRKETVELKTRLDQAETERITAKRSYDEARKEHRRNETMVKDAKIKTEDIRQNIRSLEDKISKLQSEALTRKRDSLSELNNKKVKLEEESRKAEQDRDKLDIDLDVARSQIQKDLSEKDILDIDVDNLYDGLSDKLKSVKSAIVTKNQKKRDDKEKLEGTIEKEIADQEKIIRDNQLMSEKLKKRAESKREEMDSLEQEVDDLKKEQTTIEKEITERKDKSESHKLKSEDIVRRGKTKVFEQEFGAGSEELAKRSADLAVNMDLVMLREDSALERGLSYLEATAKQQGREGLKGFRGRIARDVFGSAGGVVAGSILGLMTGGMGWLALGGAAAGLWRKESEQLGEREFGKTLLDSLASEFGKADRLTLTIAPRELAKLNLSEDQLVLLYGACQRAVKTEKMSSADIAALSRLANRTRHLVVQKRAGTGREQELIPGIGIADYSRLLGRKVKADKPAEESIEAKASLRTRAVGHVDNLLDSLGAGFNIFKKPKPH